MPVTRFAPSPSGLLHLGHAYSALFAVQAAGPGGRFLLRMEDIDTTRCRPEFIEAAERDLAWLGLVWEQPVRRQSEHFADYAVALERLQARGVVYPCFCTRADIAAEIARSPNAPHGPDGALYPGTCRNLPEAERASRIATGAAYALRLDVAKAMRVAGLLYWRDLDRGEQAARPDALGDVVLARKEMPASYHLAVTVDDALQGVTLVTRGEDLFHATHIHRLLQALLDLPVPDWRHHRLLTDKRGVRFAKRDSSLTIAALREAGHSPGALRAMTGIA